MMMNTDGVICLLAAACEEAGSVRQWAIRHGLSHVYVGQVLRRQKPPGEGVLRPLKLRKTVIYEPLQED